MAVSIPAQRSIWFIVISLGGIVLSVMIASLFVGYKPAAVNMGINGYSIGTGSTKQSSLDSMGANRTEVSIKSPENSEQGGSTVVPEVPAFDPTPSVDELQRIKNGNTSGIGSYSVAEVPAFAPTLSVVEEMPPKLWIDELQDAESDIDSVSASGSDSKKPAPSVSSAFKNGRGVGGHGVASLNQTAPFAALHSPPSKDYEKSKLSKYLSCHLIVCSILDILVLINV